MPLPTTLPLEPPLYNLSIKNAQMLNGNCGIFSMIKILDLPLGIYLFVIILFILLRIYLITRKNAAAPHLFAVAGKLLALTNSAYKVDTAHLFFFWLSFRPALALEEAFQSYPRGLLTGLPVIQSI